MRVRTVCKAHWRRMILLFPALLFLGLWAAYALATGPVNLAQYPDACSSPYLLPWPAGITYRCIQSNRGIVSHRGGDYFAYDFYMPVGSDICAARAGKVVRVVQEHDGNGYKWPNNVVVIEHEDKTLGVYAHIMKDGGKVAVGDMVRQGQVIAASGNVGNSMMPHLHFHVSAPDRKRTLPVTFADCRRHKGIPRMFYNYTSANAVVATGDQD